MKIDGRAAARATQAARLERAHGGKIGPDLLELVAGARLAQPRDEPGDRLLLAFAVVAAAFAVAQRQEQFLLDSRAYGASTEAALNPRRPDGFRYDWPPAVWNVTATPPGYVICMGPAAGTVLAARNDGRLCVNNLGQRWRESDGNAAFDAADCAWENNACRVSGEG